MKTILVCAAQAPYVTGGAEVLVRELAEQLARRGFRTDVVSVPFHGHPPAEIVRQAIAWRLLELRQTTGRPVDLVIPTKFPSYLVRHPRKVAWLFHQHREAYDLFGTALSAFTDSPGDREARESIRVMDETALGECRAIYTISANVADRLSRFNRLSGTPLHPPPRNAGRFRTDGYEDYLLYAGRLERVKRVDLAVRTLAQVGAHMRLKVAGKGAAEPDLRRLAEELGVDDRVDFLGFVSEEDLLTLYARCRATWYTPQDEDYGYVTVESFLSRKPVITSTDAGGPLEFVEDGVNGCVSAPDPEALASAVDRIFSLTDTRLRDMGEEGRGRVAHITWDRVVDRLTESIR
jgi:glycosyltransferase involved in cell wall biosynthesis